jgi:hypothetical protein
MPLCVMPSKAANAAMNSIIDVKLMRVFKSVCRNTALSFSCSGGIAVPGFTRPTI